MSGVVVDSSVWIDFFAGRSIPSLEEALTQGTVVLPPLVVAELVSGARQQQRSAIEDLLQEFPLHETPLAHWIRVGELRRDLRNKGISISIPDAHVAQCALDRDVVLLSRDAVFASIARHSSLRVHSA